MPELLAPIHPKLVHFPIALFISALLLEIISLIARKEDWHRCALILYTAAALLTPVVVRTGMWEVDRIRLSHPILTSHRLFALWTMWVSLMSLPVLYFLNRERPGWVKPLFVVLLLAVAVLVTFAGHYGGTMVYEYGVGTEAF